MEIYIRSRGFSQEDGYGWLPEIPSIMTTNRVTELIQSEAPSIVLGRYGGRLLLLVTGLEAQRMDFRDRLIRNSIAFMAEDSPETEQKLRAIAARALRSFIEEGQKDVLDTEIDRAVTFGGDFGFQVVWEELQGLVSTATPLEKPTNGDLEREELSSDKVGKNCDRLKQDLAEKLEKYPLPDREGSLVIVTGIKTEDTLINAGVWRGLSKGVEAEDWKTIREREYIFLPEEQPLSSSGTQMNETATLVARIVGIGLLMLGWLWF